MNNKKIIGIIISVVVVVGLSISIPLALRNGANNSSNNNTNTGNTTTTTTTNTTTTTTTTNTTNTTTTDVNAPIVHILNPQNGNYYNATQPLILSAQDDVGVNTIWYNWNGTDTIYTNSVNITFGYGTFMLHAYANDSAGNVGSASVKFTITKSQPINIGSPFVSVWNTSKTSSGSSNSNEITLPLVSTGTYNFIVNWGDNSNSTITSVTQGAITHIYANPGVYTLNITGTLNGWRFNDLGDVLKLMDIENWGDLQLGNLGYYFYGCSNLNSTATDTLNLNGTTNLSYMFAGDSVFNGNISNWDVSKVTNMLGMFSQDYAFNQPIGNWDVSSVTDMQGMFTYDSAFNQPIGNWDVSSVTTMNDMFCLDPAFNQSIDNWDVSSVTDMNGMFDKDSAFNQSIDNWDVSSVTTMSDMFAYASAFNQNLGSWNVSSVTTMQLMFTGVTLSQTNIDDTVVGWAGLPSLQTGVTFTYGNTAPDTSNSTVNNAVTILTNDGWTFDPLL